MATRKIKSTGIRSPDSNSKNHTIVIGQLKEVAEVGQRLRGNPLDSFVRVSELVDAGVLRVVDGQVLPASTLQAILDAAALAAALALKADKSTQIVAGAGLTGGGDLAATRTLNVIAGTGITVNANDVALSAASIASLLLADTSVQPARNLIAGAGLTGGGTLAADRTFDIGAGTGITVNANDVALSAASIASLALANTSVQPARTLTAGAGLTGGGSLAADRTFDVGAGTGLTVNANDVALSAASIASLLLADTSVQPARNLIAGAGLTGGGTLAADRTFDIGAGTGITVNANDIQIATAYQAANPSGLIGMSAVNGVATTPLRSDGLHAIDPAIVPTWTGRHIYNTTSGTQLLTGTTTVNANQQLGSDPAHLVDIVNDGTAFNVLRISTYGTGLQGENNYHFQRARGSVATPTAVKSGDVFMSMGFRGHNGTTISASKGAFQGIATEDWTGVANGLKFLFQATANGSTTRTDSMEFTGQGAGVFNGTISAPGLYLVNSVGCGIYRPASNILGLTAPTAVSFSVNSAEAGRFSTNGAAQFSGGFGGGFAAVPGLELGVSGGGGLIQAINRNTSAYIPARFDGSRFEVAISGVFGFSINGVTTTGAQTATFTATNKPGAGTAGPISWLPVLTAGVVQGYIPIFGA